jgi:integrase
MASRKDPRTGNYFFRKWVKLSDGTRKRIFGATDESGQPFKKKSECDAAEQAALEKIRNPPKAPVPTFDEWFNGRFWQEWVLGGSRGANKASEQQSKRSIYRYHLHGFFGSLPLDKIDDALVNVFRARLRAQREKDGTPSLSEKRINNILTVLSKPLNYAHKVKVIASAPHVGISKLERPEAEFYEFEQWADLLLATESVDERVATLLAGDHGLRVGEVRALRMKEDVDLKARTITVAQAVYEVDKIDVFDKPKGKTRRTIPMSAELYKLLRHRLPSGYVVNGTKDGEHGKYLSLGESRWLMQSLAKRAGLGGVNPYGAWHVLRHTFATHAAMLGANPWTLMNWMGHKRVEETSLYVSLANAHAREIPPSVIAAGEGITDPDKRLRAQLDARSEIRGTRAADGQWKAPKKGNR